MHAQGTHRSFFLQDVPRQGNTFVEDTALREVMSRLVRTHSPAAWDSLETELGNFGDRCAPAVFEANDGKPAANLVQASSEHGWGAGPGQGDIFDAGRNSNDPANEPYLVTHGSWGARQDRIHVSEGWKFMHDVSASEGLIALGYDHGRKTYGPFARLVQAAKLYMFSPVCAMYTCPLAMTDGAAKACEEALGRVKELGLSDVVVRELEDHYAHLTSLEPREFFTSGQWMTERTGGSDIGNTETLATPEDPNNPDGDWYRLSGYKFFTSATTSELSFTLARIVDPKTGEAKQGSRGLSLFVVQTWRERQRSIIVHRLKDKLGTRPVPTAELELNDTRALRIGPEGRGVALMSSLFNVTRIHNAVGNTASMRGLLSIARDYAHRRTVFGKSLAQQPLHLTTLADAEVLFRAALQFVMYEGMLFGRTEFEKQNSESRDNVILRVLTPLGKLWVAKTAIADVSELLESFGGAGYMEDTGLPVALRDVQVGSIWEGTTNVLSLDVLRALAKHPSSFGLFVADVRDRADLARSVATDSNQLVLADAAEAVSANLDRLVHFYDEELRRLEPDQMTARARQLALSMARLYAASLLLEHACWSEATYVDAAIALRFCSNFGSVVTVGVPGAQLPHCFECDREIALDIDVTTGEPRGCGNVDPKTERPRARL